MSVKNRAGKRRRHAQTCTGKVPHASRGDAEKALWSLVNKRGAVARQMQAYRCLACRRCVAHGAADAGLRLGEHARGMGAIAMSEPEIFHFPPIDLPGKTKHGGYAYVIEFDAGLVKVGMTQHPQSRIPAYISHAGVFGVRPLRGWLSPLHEDPAGTEVRLIAVATEMGGAPTGREYFRGVDFREVVGRATTFTYSPVGFEAADKRSQAFHDALVRTFGGKRSPETVIAEVFDRRGDTYDLPELGAEAVPRDLIRLVAESLGASVADVLAMDYVGIVEATVLARVKLEALRLREYAALNGRADLLRPLREVRAAARQLQIVFPSEAA